MGSTDAKVTIIEYASLTCPHCAEFHKNVLPTLKSKYIDTGKVRYILREFPLDDLATAGFMLARCAGDEKYYAIVDLPTGFIWTRGNCGQGTFKASSGEISLDYAKTNWILYDFDWNNRSAAAAA